jgi:transposase
MTGARFVHDTLELAGWEVDIADAQKVKGLAPLACKTDKIDAWVLAELSRRDLVPAIWLPDPAVRGERERARFRLHLVRHRVMLKNRIHASLMSFGKPCPVSDLFGRQGRATLAGLDLPEPWTENITTALRMIDDLGEEIGGIERELRTQGAQHPYVSLLQSVPGVAWVLGYTIASEIGDISRFASPKQLGGYTGLCPRVIQSGEKDWRDPGQERPQVPALGAHRSGGPRRPAPDLRRALPAHQESARPPTRRQGRPGRGGPQAHRGHLAHAPDGLVLFSGKVPLRIWSRFDDPG